MLLPRLNRRSFVGTALTACSANLIGTRLLGQDRPAVRSPRATSGDRQVEPKWDERLDDHRRPAAGGSRRQQRQGHPGGRRYVARLGGGTVKIAARHVSPAQRGLSQLERSAPRQRPETILIKEPSSSTKLVGDSDWYDQEITLADAPGFQVGDGICLRAKNPHNGGRDRHQANARRPLGQSLQARPGPARELLAEGRRRPPPRSFRFSAARTSPTS